MKIALLSPFYPHRGGIAQFSDRLSDALEKKHPIKRFGFKQLYPNILFPGKTQYVNPINPKLEQAEQTLNSINPFSFAATVKAIRKYNPDVLIIAYWMPFFVPAYAHIANRIKKKSKIIALVHNSFPHESHVFDKIMFKQFIKQCDQVVVLSETVKLDVLSLKLNKPILYTPHPLYDHFGTSLNKNEACNLLKINPQKKILLFFGLIRDYKGLDLLLKAFSQLSEDYHLIIAGESYGPFDSYEQLIKKLNIKDKVSLYINYIPDKDVALYFSAADALVLPYRTATQSGVVSIAYHYEKPMVATPVGDFPNSIKKTSSGILAKDITADALHEAIEELFNANLLTQYSQSIQALKKELSWEVMAERLTFFLEER